MLYEGSDRNIHILGDGEELKHYKYIKKIKQGSGWRYFYTPEELKAYYEGSKSAYNVGNAIQNTRGDIKTNKKINSLERKKNATQEDNAWRAYQESKLRGTSDKKAYRAAAKSIIKDEAKFQLEKKKLQTKNDLDKKKRAANSEAKAVTGTAKLAAKGAKDAADSVPRLEKHGNKYYIADKKTQNKIERSGAGGNVIDRTSKKSLGNGWNEYKMSTKYKNRFGAAEYKDRAKRNSGGALKKAGELAKSNAYKGAEKGITPKYEKYEAKNVANKKISEIKNKAAKGRSAVEKKLKKNKKK